jgi:uncharacterized YccA/Bax inhibitor family protein
MRLRSSNPVLRNMKMDHYYEDEFSASYKGVTLKTGYLLAIISITAMYLMTSLQQVENLNGLMIGVFAAPIIAIIMVILTHSFPNIAFFTTTIYALCEGLFLGFVSTLFSALYGQGVVQMALTGTIGVFFGMLFLYSTGIIVVGNFMRRFLYSMLMGLFLTSIILVLFSAFGSPINENLYFGIVVISVIVSSLYLLIDFDNVTRLVDEGASKKYEWSLSLGLVVTIVWLYVELLRLFAIFARRD